MCMYVCARDGSERWVIDGRNHEKHTLKHTRTHSHTLSLTVARACVAVLSRCTDIDVGTEEQIYADDVDDNDDDDDEEGDTSHRNVKDRVPTPLPNSVEEEEEEEACKSDDGEGKASPDLGPLTGEEAPYNWDSDTPPSTPLPAKATVEASAVDDDDAADASIGQASTGNKTVKDAYLDIAGEDDEQ